MIFFGYFYIQKFHLYKVSFLGRSQGTCVGRGSHSESGGSDKICATKLAGREVHRGNQRRYTNISILKWKRSHHIGHRHSIKYALGFGSILQRRKKLGVRYKYQLPLGLS